MRNIFTRRSPAKPVIAEPTPVPQAVAESKIKAQAIHGMLLTDGWQYAKNILLEKIAEAKDSVFTLDIEADAQKIIAIYHRASAMQELYDHLIFQLNWAIQTDSKPEDMTAFNYFSV